MARMRLVGLAPVAVFAVSAVAAATASAVKPALRGPDASRGASPLH
jgi:hypothetical protein